LLNEADGVLPLFFWKWLLDMRGGCVFFSSSGSIVILRSRERNRKITKN